MCRPRAAADDASESDATDGDEIEAAKALERPRCANWSRDGLAKTLAGRTAASQRPAPFIATCANNGEGDI